MTRCRTNLYTLIKMVSKQHKSTSDGVALCGGAHHQQGFKTRV